MATEREDPKVKLLEIAVGLEREAVVMTADLLIANSKERQRLLHSAAIMRHAHRTEELLASIAGELRALRETLAKGNDKCPELGCYRDRGHTGNCDDH